MLSFDDDMGEEDAEFKVKKSKESRRLIKMRDKEKKEDSKNGKADEDDVKVLGDQNGNRNKNVHIIDDDIGIILKVGLHSL